MPLIETESLVIKTYGLGDADRIVVLLTRDHGVVRGVAKGAKRLKSRFGSSLEPFSIVRANYFEKDSVELVSIQKIELIQSNFAAASNPDFLQKFAYLGELLVTLSPPHDPNEILYRMVRSCVESAAANAAGLLGIGVYFELWMLHLSGYMPDWSRCDQCSRLFDQIEETSVRANFHLMCGNCRRSGGYGLSSRARGLVASARRLSPDDFVMSAAEDGGSLDELSAVLKEMISRSIGRKVVGETSLAISV
jgi:DNA repair protein RecO (recombination protein O)